MRLIHHDSALAEIEVGQQVYRVPLKHEDDRHTLYEGPYGSGVIQFFVIRGGRPLGNHYHKKTQEEFHILAGGGEVTTVMIDRYGRPVGQTEWKRRLAPGGILLMMPRMAHALCLEPGTLMACKATQPYDPTDVFPTPWLVP